MLEKEKNTDKYGRQRSVHIINGYMAILLKSTNGEGLSSRPSLI